MDGDDAEPLISAFDQLIGAAAPFEPGLFGNLVVFEVPPNDRTVQLRIMFWSEAGWARISERDKPLMFKQIPSGYVSWVVVYRDA